MKMLHMVAFLLLIIGGLNWGLVGLFHLDLVMSLFGSVPIFVQLIYILVGLSAVYLLFTHQGDCRVCGMKGKGKK